MHPEGASVEAAGVSACKHCEARAYTYSAGCPQCMLRWEARLPRRFVLGRLRELEKQKGRAVMEARAAELRMERLLE